MKYNYVSKPVKVRAVQWQGWHVKLKGIIGHWKYPQLACYLNFQNEVYPGNWIVTHPNKTIEILNSVKFQRKFQQINDY